MIGGLLQPAHVTLDTVEPIRQNDCLPQMRHHFDKKRFLDWSEVFAIIDVPVQSQDENRVVRHAYSSAHESTEADVREPFVKFRELAVPFFKQISVAQEHLRSAQPEAGMRSQSRVPIARDEYIIVRRIRRRSGILRRPLDIGPIVARGKQLNRGTAGPHGMTDLIKDHRPVTPIRGTDIEIHQYITQLAYHHALPALTRPRPD